MKELKAYKTRTYEFEFGNEIYLIDVVDNPDQDIYEYWLYNKDYDVKMFVHGIPKNTVSYDGFIEGIWNGISLDITNYRDAFEN